MWLLALYCTNHRAPLLSHSLCDDTKNYLVNECKLPCIRVNCDYITSLHSLNYYIPVADRDQLRKSNRHSERKGRIQFKITADDFFAKFVQCINETNKWKYSPSMCRCMIQFNNNNPSQPIFMWKLNVLRVETCRKTNKRPNSERRVEKQKETRNKSDKWNKNAKCGCNTGQFRPDWKHTNWLRALCTHTIVNSLCRWEYNSCDKESENGECLWSFI